MSRSALAALNAGLLLAAAAVVGWLLGVTQARETAAEKRAALAAGRALETIRLPDGRCAFFPPEIREAR